MRFILAAISLALLLASSPADARRSTQHSYHPMWSWAGAYYAPSRYHAPRKRLTRKARLARAKAAKIAKAKRVSARKARRIAAQKARLAKRNAQAARLSPPVAKLAKTMPPPVAAAAVVMGAVGDAVKTVLNIPKMGVVGSRPRGCPSRHCGCSLSLRLFGKIIPSLNLAANWKRFPPAKPAPGMVASRRGHVFQILQHVKGDRWLAWDANSGRGLTRVHVRSIRGFTIHNPTRA